MTGKSSRKFLAFDLGASNGRAVVGLFDGSRLTWEDVHRFPNAYVRVSGSLYWDVLRLYSEVLEGMTLYAARWGADPESIGIDTWGVDYGLIDGHGDLVGNPYCYRDERTAGMVEAITGIMDEYEVYRITGTRLTSINTICQLYSMVCRNSVQLALADAFLMMPCLLNHFLTGEKLQEHSVMTTTCLYDTQADAPATGFFEALGIPTGIMPQVVKPGTMVGKLRSAVAEEIGLGAVRVTAPATHDTASAVISVPADEGRTWAFLSCGTWSVLGIESDKPCTSRESYDLGISNAATAQGKFMTITSATGLWIIQECKRIWDRQGIPADYGEMVELARAAPPFSAFIAVDDSSFVSPGSMPEAIAAYCQRTTQRIPAAKGTFIRVVLESLSLRYRAALRDVERATGKRADVLHIVGGGARNSLLCQFAADALGIPVLAGPVEATAIGNILMQMVGNGEFGSVSEARRVLRESCRMVEYQPGDSGPWDEAHERYRRIVARN